MNVPGLMKNNIFLTLIFSTAVGVCTLAAIKKAEAKKQAVPIKVLFKPDQVGDFVPKHYNVAQATVCPRVLTPSDPIVAREGAEFDHCPHCNMGVFFQHENKLSCSYCEKEG